MSLWKRARIIPRNLEKRPLDILFVCFGNMHRSPTAERIFKEILEKRGYKVAGNGQIIDYDVCVSSAGVSVEDDDGNQFDRESGNRADFIFALDEMIEEIILSCYDMPRNKVANLSIPDTYTRNQPELCARLEADLPKYLPVLGLK